MRAIKSNMEDQVITKDRKILHCPKCGAEYSGNRGDYFMFPENYVFCCCEAEMELVTKRVLVNYIQ